MWSNISQTWLIVFLSISASGSSFTVIACGEVKLLRDLLCDILVSQKLHTSATIRDAVRLFFKICVNDFKISNWCKVAKYIPCKEKYT